MGTIKPIWTEILDTFEKWLVLPNYDIVEVVAATVLANRLRGEPLWLALVGPSSSGKTEVVRALETLQRIHPVDGFTTSTLASGYKPGKSKRGEKNGSLGEYGLLAKMFDGEPHIITIGDFSTILSKRYEFRNEIMNQLRRLYDGAWDVSYGNGVTVQWRGKVGVIVCSTGAYDREMGAQSVFGDRFLVCRNVPGDPVIVAEKAGENAKSTERMRQELRVAMRLIDKIDLPLDPVKLSIDARTLVSKLCAFVARARTQVPREGYKHEIVAVPEIEGTGRMSAQLHQLLRGLLVWRGRDEITNEEIELVERVAFGTIPTLRLEIMRHIKPDGTLSSELLAKTGVPRSVLFRTLEDLCLLELLWQDTYVRDKRAVLYKPFEADKGFFYQLSKLEGF